MCTVVILCLFSEHMFIFSTACHQDTGLRSGQNTAERPNQPEHLVSDPCMGSVLVLRTALHWTVGCCCMPVARSNVDTERAQHLDFHVGERQLVSKLLLVASFHFARVACKRSRSRIDCIDSCLFFCLMKKKRVIKKSVVKDRKVGGGGVSEVSSLKVKRQRNSLQVGFLLS